MEDELVDVLVESPKGSRVKYEWDPEREAIRFDRRMTTSTVFPADYGHVPGTSGADGEALDAMILTATGTFPGCWVRARPIGVFWITYDGEREAKIVTVPDGDPDWADVEDVSDLPEHRREEISHFLDVYKDLDAGRTPSAAGYEGREAALRVVAEARQAAQAQAVRR